MAARYDGLTARAYRRLLKVARTIADLAGTIESLLNISIENMPLESAPA